MKKLILVLLTVLLLTSPVAAQDEQQPIRVGSKLFTEDQLLGHIVYVALEMAGYPVEDKLATGNTTVARDALLTNQIDLYPEYTGTAFSVFFNSDLIGPVFGYDSETIYGIVSSYDSAYNDLVWLEPSPIDNTYVLVVKADFAEEHGLVDLATFAEYVNSGGEVMLAANDEFTTRTDGLLAMEEAYGFDIRGNQMLVVAGATPDVMVEALNANVNGINVAFATGVSGLIYEYELVALYDESEFLIPYEPAVVIRGALLRRNPEIVTVLNPIFRALNPDLLIDLVAQVEVYDRSPREVAIEFVTKFNSGEIYEELEQHLSEETEVEGEE